jgi:hypothetical protein
VCALGEGAGAHLEGRGGDVCLFVCLFVCLDFFFLFFFFFLFLSSSPFLEGVYVYLDCAMKKHVLYEALRMEMEEQQFRLFFFLSSGLSNRRIFVCQLPSEKKTNNIIRKKEKKKKNKVEHRASDLI